MGFALEQEVRDSSRSIVGGATRFFSGTMLSRISGLARDVLMAAAFGSQPSVAALLMAFRFASLPRRLLAEGAMQSALIPHFEGLRAEEPARAARLLRDLALCITLFLVLVLGLGEGAWFQWGGSLPAGRQEVLRLTAILLPGLFFIALYGIAATLLQCERRYFIPSVAPALFNVVWIVATIAVWHCEAFVAMQWVAYALVAGLACQFFLLLLPALRSLRRLDSSSLWRRICPFSADVRGLVRPLALAILGVGAQQINSALDPIFARLADPSGPAYLWYAVRLQQLPLALFGLALTSALLPPLTRAVKQGNGGQVRHFLTFALSTAATVMIPCLFAMLATGRAAVAVVYGRGAFAAQALASTTQCLWGYALAVVPMTGVLLFAGLCYAHREYRLPAATSAISVLLNTVLNATLVFTMGLGPPALALATALSAWVQASVLGWECSKRWGIPWRVLMVVAGRATLGGLCGWGVAHQLPHAVVCGNFLGNITTFTAQGAAFILVCGGVVLVLRRVGKKVAYNGDVDGNR